MKRLFCVILFLIDLLQPAPASAQIPDGTFLFRDRETQGLRPESDILRGALDAAFEPVTPQSRLNIGYTKDVMWFRIPTAEFLHNVRADRVLSMDYALNDRVTLYVARPDGQVIYDKSIGKSVAFKERTFRSRFLQFDLSLMRDLVSTLPPADQNALRVLLRVESSGSVNTGFRIQDLRDVTRENYSAAQAALIYLGMATVIFLYNSLIMLVTRSASYLYYIAFVVPMSLMTLSLQGISFELFWPDHPEFNTFAGMFFGAGAGVTLSLMNLRNFRKQLDAWYPRFKLFLKCAIVYCSFTMLLATINVRWANIPVLLGILVICATCLVFYIALSLRRDRQGYFYLASMGFVVGAGVLTVARMMALVPSNMFVDNAYLFGSGVEMTVISLALGDKYRQIELQQKKIHKDMIEIQKTNIMELDQKVAERTEDLQRKAQEVRGILNALDSAVFVVQKSDASAAGFKVGDIPSSTAARFFGEQALQPDFDPLAALDQLVEPMEKDKISALVSTYHAAIHEDEMNFSLNSQLTSAVVRLRSGQVFKLSSAPVLERDGAIVRGIVLSVHDITEAVARDEAAHHMAAKTEAIEATIAAGREHGARLLTQIRLVLADLGSLGITDMPPSTFRGCSQQFMRDLHTLKGFSRTYRFDALASHIHALESEVLALPACDSNLRTLLDIALQFSRRLQIYEWAYFIIHRHEAEGAESKDLAQVFVDTTRQLRSFARERKNVDLVADIQGPPVLMTHADAAIFDRAMIHIVKNSIDHGMDPGSGCRTCRVQFRIEDNGRRLVYRDSGRGLNLTQILQREQGHDGPGQPRHLSDHEAAMLIFKPGFTTRSDIDDISGRGVGMDAVRNDMQKLGFEADIRILDVSQQDGQTMARVEFVFVKAA